jgi:IS5 family transposase
MEGMCSLELELKPSMSTWVSGALTRVNLGIDIKHPGKFKSQTEQEKKMLKRRQAIEPIIGHLKADHRMNRCHLKGADGDSLDAVLCAAG